LLIIREAKEMATSHTSKKILVSMLLAGILLLAGLPLALSTAPTPTGRGWYWKASYPNYAPSGMPDFSQEQDSWKKITAGPDGILQSTPTGDDILNQQDNCIAPGDNAHLDTAPSGDDTTAWCYCGPTAVANCLWWFDSKYEDPDGTPGDNHNEFNLVKDYGAGDDHAKANAPLLIEKLAKALQTTTKGTTYTSDMQTGLTQWFADTGLSSMFTVHTYQAPTFDNVSSAITQSQDVILLLNDYTQSQGNLIIDQQMPVIQTTNDNLQPQLAWDYQSFVPSASRLDAIDVCLVSNGAPCDVQMNIYNAPPPSAPIGTCILNPGNLAVPTWIRFTFPGLPIVPGMTYYFDLSELTPPPDQYHYEWHYVQDNQLDPYPPGQGWINGAPGPQFFDWTFITYYYDPQTVNTAGHFVTCAGVDTQAQKIAISDPAFNVKTPAATDHNDAKNVSHDEYSVQIGTPLPGINCTWYIEGYPVDANYTVVEAAVIICPLHGLTPDLDAHGSLTWSNVKAGSTVTGTFTVSNIGDTQSRLDWKILSWPDWGTWTFSPARGDNLHPEDGALNVTATIVAPSPCDFGYTSQTFTGNITIVNEENASDVCAIPISLTAPYHPSHPFWDWLLSWLAWLQRFIRPAL
jgi:hypothetical protein